MSDNEQTILKVRSATSASELASALAHAIYDGKDVSLRAIGAGAVNQAIKGVIIAQGFVGTRGLRLHVVPGFDVVRIDDGEVTAIVLRIIVN